MDNQLNKAGALKRAGWGPNNAMATLIAALGACMFGIANDRKAWVFADNEGTPFKTMCGTATDDSNFTFSETVMQLPLPFTLAFGDQDTAGSKRIRITDGGMFFETTADGTNWTEMGAFL